MTENILFSICIPTYNRATAVCKSVSDILSCEDARLEVIVSDNNSTDNTLALLNDIKDARLKVITSEQNAGSTANSVKALASGNGKYVMFLTDKDYVLMHNMPQIFSVLEENNFAAGWFTLDCKADSLSLNISRDKQAAFTNMAYLSKHPSGYFFNKELLSKMNIKQRFSDVDKTRGFVFEFLFAELAAMGLAVEISVNFCRSVPPPFDGLKHSFTYSPEKNNIFFFPQNRFDTFEKYLAHLNTLPLKRSERRRVLKHLVERTFLQCVYWYANDLQNKPVCDWYNIKEAQRTPPPEHERLAAFYKMLKSAKSFKNIIEKYRYIYKYKRKIIKIKWKNAKLKLYF